MVIFSILSAAMIFFIILFFGTQVILPALQGRALFPILREQSKLENQIAELKQQGVEKDLQATIDQMKEEQNPVEVVDADEVKQ